MLLQSSLQPVFARARPRPGDLSLAVRWSRPAFVELLRPVWRRSPLPRLSLEDFICPCLRFGIGRPHGLPGADGGADQQGEGHDGGGGERGAVLAGEFAEAVAWRRGGRPGPVRRSGSAGCRPPGRWPSRSGGCGPSPGPSSRSSPARRGRASLKLGRLGAAGWRRWTASVPLVLSLVLGFGGSSSRMIRSISSKAGRCGAVCLSNGVVPVSSS